MFHAYQSERILRRVILLSIVLGLMIVDPVARPAAARQVLSCQLEAAYDLMPRVVMPGKPDTRPVFSVAGKCTFPTPGFSVELKPHAPPSPDPKILLLDAIVRAPTNPVPQVPTDVSVRYSIPGSPPPPKTGILVEQVIILPDNLVLPVKRYR
jgi:hypothetical protein